MQEHGPFYELMQRYLFTLVRQILQFGACHRMHTMEQRCARWLLMMHDRTESDTFPLTQELLSDMLGVRRGTVNQALRALKRTGSIQYVRGQMTVLYRAGLEKASCLCYHLIRHEYGDLKLG